MPSHSHDGSLAPLTEEHQAARERLKQDVTHLALHIGPRNVGHLDALNAAALHIQKSLQAQGYSVAEQAFRVGGKDLRNLIAEKRGRAGAGKVLVLGAHYDTVADTPGANDNASGVAALLELSRSLKQADLRRTVRFVFFVNEEPPFFQTEQMGSLVYARQLQRDREQVEMIALETIGYYSDREGSQQYPPAIAMLYPKRGNFVAFVGDESSGDFLKEVLTAFRENVQFPSEGLAAPASIPGVGWSDHWSFWQAGYSALMVTDTAPFRYSHYHLPTDTPDKLDFDRMTRVVTGLDRVVRVLAGR